MNILTLILFPFSMLYRAVTGVRNRLYDNGFKPVATFDVPVIGVGNLSVGGTGKTPMVEYLIRLLRPQFKIGTLSRGYGRQTKGIRTAGPADSARTIGDEPYQLYKKFGKEVKVTVGEDRALAISYLMHEEPQPQVLVLDDVFQHRRVKPSFQLLLTDYHRPFYNDHVLPAGRLRESRKGASRADAVVVTKCPFEMTPVEMDTMERMIRRYTPSPVFFSGIRYGEPVGISQASAKLEKVVLVTGIANAAPLKTFVAERFQLIRHFAYGDHHLFSAADVRAFIALAQAHGACVLTTEKDAARLADERLAPLISGTSLFYLPVEAVFLKSGKDFDMLVLHAVEDFNTESMR